MDKKFLSGGSTGIPLVKGGYDALQDACELLRDRQYKQVEQILQEQQETAQQSGQMAMVAICAAASQLCHTCQQFQTDRELHQLGLEEAKTYERESRQQLHVVFTMLSQLMLPETEEKVLTAPDPPSTRSQFAKSKETESAKKPTFLHKVKQLLSFDLTLPPDKSRAGAEHENDVLQISPTEQLEYSAFLESPTREQIATSQSNNTPTLSVYCLGPFRAYVNDMLIDDWSGQKSKSIFKYLVIYREQLVPIEILLDLFWHDDEPESARRNLYQAIYLLRQSLKKGDISFPFIMSTNGCYCLNPELNVWLDIDAFSAYYTAGLRLETHGQLMEAVKKYEVADTLYTGNFLAEDIYEEWSANVRRNLKNAYLKILGSLCHFYFRQENWALSIAFGQKILNMDSCREEIYRLLMLAYYWQGQRPLAVRQYHRCVKILETELNVPPMLETEKLYKKILINETQNSDLRKMNPN